MKSEFRFAAFVMMLGASLFGQETGAGAKDASPASLIETARALFEDGDEDGARSLLASALTNRSGDKLFHLHALQLQLEFKDLKAAADSLSRMCQFVGDDEAARLKKLRRALLKISKDAKAKDRSIDTFAHQVKGLRDGDKLAVVDALPVVWSWAAVDSKDARLQFAQFEVLAADTPWQDLTRAKTLCEDLLVGLPFDTSERLPSGVKILLRHLELGEDEAVALKQLLDRLDNKLTQLTAQVVANDSSPDGDAQDTNESESEQPVPSARAGAAEASAAKSESARAALLAGVEAGNLAEILAQLAVMAAAHPENKLVQLGVGLAGSSLGADGIDKEAAASASFSPHSWKPHRR